VSMARSKRSVWPAVIKRSADPVRAKHFLGLLRDTSAARKLQTASAEQARILAALFSGSQALSTLLVGHPEWMDLMRPSVLRFPRRQDGLRQEVRLSLQPLLETDDYETGLKCVRDFKQREMLRIAARDLARLANATEITQEISDVADVSLGAVWRICRQQLNHRHGCPCHQDAQGRWQPTAGCVLGMGKLGGHELNYSSDVDVLLVYEEEGAVFKGPPESKDKTNVNLTNHQFFNRLAEAFIAEVTRMAPEGMLYRIDLRLRPEGDAGPLSRSLASYENFYAQWGQTWERMMLIKARRVAGDETMAAEFLEMIQAFRYPRSINQSVLGEIAAMKNRIENEVLKAGELERNVKLGRGGIREIEFVAQAFQLLHAGRQPFLQGAQTLPALKKLAQYELLPASDAGSLSEAYIFLRDLEHRLQMESNLQTHTIPPGRHAQERLGRLMGFKTLKQFLQAHETHRREVRRIFDQTFKTPAEEKQPQVSFPRHFDGAEAEWKQLLAAHAFKDVDSALRVLREFVQGPGYGHVSPRTRELAFQLLPRLFGLCRPERSASKRREHEVAAEKATVRRLKNPKPERVLSDPDRVVTRLDSFIAAYGARATLFELWNSTPAIFELLALLFDRSEFLAELAIRTPDLVDELVTSGRLRQRKTAVETLRDLRHGRGDEDQHLWLRRYHQAELMRIGLRDILGLADFEQYLSELSALADACLQYACEVVLRKNKIKTPPFAIIGLGKLGGAEIDYGSDLDLLFVADPKAKNLARLAELALQIIDLLAKRTEQGIVFHTDARLRPDGEKGLLVNTLDACEDYYRQRALLWEIQSLSRTRAVAGAPAIGERFQQLAAALTNFKHPNLPLAAYTPEWKQQIHQMRMRIEKERTPPGKDELALKTGKGGLMDAEFIAQAVCLEHGWREASTLRALERGRRAGVLPGAGKLIENYRLLRRVEGILRRWSYEGETVLPGDPAAYHRVAVRCGFETSGAFRHALSEWRTAVREVYLKVFLARVTSYPAGD
jgi:glutamate-ammonia-ligase adenylyltransferase